MSKLSLVFDDDIDCNEDEHAVNIQPFSPAGTNEMDKSEVKQNKEQTPTRDTSHEDNETLSPGGLSDRRVHGESDGDVDEDEKDDDFEYIVETPRQEDNIENQSEANSSVSSSVSPDKKKVFGFFSLSPKRKSSPGSTQSTSFFSSFRSPNKGLPPNSPVLRSNVTDPVRGPKSPVPILKSRSVSSLDQSTKHSRRQSTVVSPMKQASHMTVKNIEAVTCIFKVTVDKIVFPENKGLDKKILPGTNLQVIFERGERNVKSYERPANENDDNGSMEVSFKEALSLTLTMYRNPLTNKYHEKKGKLTIMQEKKKSKFIKPFSQPFKEIGTVQFDLAKVFDDYISVDKVLGVTQCPIPGTSIHVTLQPKVIGEDMAQFQKPRTNKEKGEVYTGDSNMDKKEGFGKMVYADGSWYEGEWRNDLKHGKGKLVNSEGEVYEGDFYEGQKHGRGHFTGKDGSFYAGEFQHGVVSGYGKYISDGNIYEGYWEDNMEHGKGKLTFSTGDVYEGDFCEDVKHGNGTWTTAGGDKYIGEFRDDCINGHGRYEWSSGDSFEGEWLNGAMHGYGEYKWSNGDVYRGQWKDNKKHGNGKFVADHGTGDVFEGTFEEDKKISGKYCFADGDIFEGKYKNDKQHGEGLMIYANGDRYEGAFKADMRHGHGVMKFANESVYEGDFYQNEMHGYGKYKSHLGDAYEGEYLHNCRHGFGKYHYHDGSYYEGNWQNNKKHGEGFYKWPNGNTFTGQFFADRKGEKGQYSVVYIVE